MKVVKLFVLLSFFVCSFQARGGDIISGRADVATFENYIKQFKDQKNKPFDELLVGTAKYFLGKPYVASTLEISAIERMVINLRQFDCTTLVENCVALSQVIKSADFSYNNYLDRLMAMRYRNGEVSGYTSRLHYTCDWIYENSNRGILTNISLELEGEKVQKEINFMTTHSHLYKHLKDNAQNIQILEEIEKSIKERDSYEIIPVSKISENEKGIKSGDIVAFATSVKGLDYSHIGIAYWKNEKLHFIHASSRLKKVVVETRTLLDYCLNSKNCTGISILRLNRK